MIKLKNEGNGEIFYATKYSAGFDICSNEETIIQPTKWALIKTGLKIIEAAEAQSLKLDNGKLMCIPEIQIRPRSGLAAKFGITVLNSPSTIDIDYRGEIMVTLINHGPDAFTVKIGDRIAQGVCALVIQLSSIQVKDVQRGSGGFGSTGI